MDINRSFSELSKIQFVCFVNGKEKDWVDSVVSYEETDDKIVVKNSYHHSYIYYKTSHGLEDSDGFTDVPYDNWILRQNIAEPKWDVILEHNIEQ